MDNASEQTSFNEYYPPLSEVKPVLIQEESPVKRKFVEQEVSPRLVSAKQAKIDEILHLKSRDFD
jgi:hypothetical protein